MTLKYKIRNYLFIIFSIFFIQCFLLSCSSEPTNDADEDGFSDVIDKCPTIPNKTNNGCPYDRHNYIILLDLSDRILQKGQIERDTSIISGIYDSFLKKLKDELYFTNKDQFKVLIANQEAQFPTNAIFEIEDNLNVDMEEVPIQNKVKKRDSKGDYMKQVASLYKEARFSDNPNHYDGADIYGYLNQSFDNDRISGDFTENFLIILTDGYQYVKGSLYKPLGPFPEATDLSDVNVAVVELNPINKRSGELTGIKNAWTEWMEKMNVNTLLLLNKQGTKKLNKQLKDFFDNPQKKSPRSINTPKKRAVNKTTKITSTPVKSNKEQSQINTTVPSNPLSSPTTVLVEKSPQYSNVKTYYADFDGDGLGDSNNIKNSTTPIVNYILIAGDKCPRRQGLKDNSGCPILNIMPNQQTVFIDEKISFNAEFPITSGDQIEWSCENCQLEGKLTNSRIQQINFSRLGKEKINLRLSNPIDGTKEIAFKDLTVKIRKERLKFYLDKVIQLNDKESQEGKELVSKIKSFTTSNCTIVDEKKNYALLGNGSIDDFLLIVGQPNITYKISFLKSEKFTVSDIIYDNSSGKIRQIVLRI